MDLERAIGRLPEGCRAAFLLHDVEGFEHQEVARILGVSQGTSKSQVHKARMKLRAMLSPHRAGVRGGDPNVERMNCHHYEAALSEYIDGALQGSDQPEDAALLDGVERHLAGCERCRAIVEDLHTLRDAARTLEPHVPPAHVWTRIASETSISSRRPGWAILPPAVRWQPLAAAAATGARARRIVDRMAPGHRAGAAPATAARPQGQPPDPALVQDVETELRLAEEHYVRAIAGLETIAKSEGSELDPQTAEVLQANLTVIDAAIGESRAALQTEPSSDVARSSLFEGLRRKVTLLQDTIALINEMRKGNQEGAARIVSGLNQ